MGYQVSRATLVLKFKSADSKVTDSVVTHNVDLDQSEPTADLGQHCLIWHFRLHIKGHYGEVKNKDSRKCLLDECGQQELYVHAC